MKCGRTRTRCSVLTPEQQSYFLFKIGLANKKILFKMVYRLLPNKTRLHKFELRESDLCSFCEERDEKMHFWSCTQAAGLGIVAKAILQENNEQRKPVSVMGAIGEA